MYKPFFNGMPLGRKDEKAKDASAGRVTNQLTH